LAPDWRSRACSCGTPRIRRRRRSREAASEPRFVFFCGGQANSNNMPHVSTRAPSAPP
jgi:hypothetical protein